jgi:arylsulfatase A-like enzyme
MSMKEEAALKPCHIALGPILLALTVGPAPQLSAATAADRPPNIVLILADDLGYGDVGCYGATKVKTPNVDRLASQGLRFTDAHCTSGTCTPSRYSLLTGEYAWRRKGTGILPGDASLIIEPGRPTLPAILAGAGYRSTAIGKWHLGLGRPKAKVDWNADIEPGPLEVGFSQCFIMPATGDRVPCVFVQDHRVVALDPNDPIAVSYGIKIGNEPTGADHPELLKMKLSNGHAGTIINGISRIGFMSGGTKALWKDEDIADNLTKQATDFIESSKDHPFFLYFATHDIHVPRVPHPRFVGTSGCGVRGDVIQEFDWSVGQVIDALERLKLADNTLLIVTSDNGPVIDDGYADGAAENLNGHTPAGPLRGGKYSNFEGGTCVPFIARWPGHIKPQTTSDALVCQVDLLRSLARLVKADVPKEAGPDSLDLLPAFLGEAKTGRDHLVEQAVGPQTLAIRRGNWKLIPRVPATARAAASPELYDLSTDPSEKNNIADTHPDIVQELSSVLQKVRESGRTP